MAQEIEMKFKVDAHAPLERRLRQLKASHLYKALQQDHYFDTPARKLLKADCGLRLRQTRRLRGGSEKLQTRALLTYKGPRRKVGTAKIRPEHQTYVDQPEAILEVLAAAGLAQMLVIEKKRSSFRLGRCQVELDELPLLGCFVEIEGPSAKAVQAAREKLGLTEANPLKEHYINLARQRCRQLGCSCKEITFSACGSCRG